MDAAYNSLKKTVLFVVAIALLLAAPRSAAAQPQIVVNPSLSNGTIQISNAGCNDSQILNLTSTGGAITIQVSVTYNVATDPYSNYNWLYASVNNQSTSPVGKGNSLFTVTIPAADGSQAGAAGINLVIGLNSQAFASSASTDQATVNLTVVDFSGATNVPITVDYANNSSCGGNTGALTNGYVSINPGTLTMTAVQGGAQTLQMQITNQTGSALNFYVGTPSNTSWLSTNASQLTSLPASATVAVSVTAAAGSMAAGTYSSQLTVVPELVNGQAAGNPLLVTVSFTVGSGSGGTGTGTLLLNGSTSTNVNFSFIASGTSATAFPAQVCIPITESNSSVGSYADSFSTTGGNWLNVNGSAFSPQNNQSFGGNCLLVVPNNSLYNLSSGVYTGTITVSDSTGSSAAANITLYVSSGSAQGVSVSPGLLYSFPSVLAGATATESQQFTITASSGVTLGTATATSTPSWFSMTTPQNVGAGPETFVVTANPSGLAQGVYSTTITLSSSSGTTNIVVSLAVGQNTTSGGGSTTSVVVPTSLSFASETGNYSWTGAQEQQAVTITGSYGGVWSTAVTYNTQGAAWLKFDGPTGATSGVFGTGPATLLVDIQPSNLSPSLTPYTAVIAVTTPSGTTNVNVSLLVTGSGNHVLLDYPASTTFTSNSGSTPASQTVIFSDTSQTFPGNSGQATPVISVTTQTSWLIASSSGNVMTLSVNPSGLATGAYAGAVTVTGSYPNSPLTYPVVLVVNGGTSAGPLTLSTSGLTFNAVANGPSPSAQAVTVSASSATTASVSLSEQSCTNENWLTISPSGFINVPTGGTSVSVSVSPAGITTATTCNGLISFTSGSSTQTVSVSMILAAAGTGGNVTVTPAGPLTFSYTQGGTNPPTQTLAIANATTGTSGIAFTVASSATWLTTNASSSVTTPFSLVVTANPASLSASSTPYTGTLTITPNGGTAVVVNVSFTVAGVPIVSATPTTMSFSYSVGGSNPPTQTVQVTGGGAAATFWVTDSSSGWLTVTPTCTTSAPCTTPNTGTFNLTVSADPTGLNAGVTYNGSITISGTGTATGTSTVNVTLAITAPLPAITKVTNSASFNTGAVSPGELISLFANTSNPIGPMPAVQLNGSNCGNPCTLVPTTMGGVQVIFLPQGIAAPLLYVSPTQINAVVPYEVQTALNSGTSVSVEVKFLGQSSNAFVLQTVATAPGIITLNGSGAGIAAMNQYDTSGNYQGVNSASNPASPGWVLTMYVTGEGSIPNAVDGAVTSSTTVKPIAGAPSVLIDDTPSTVQYYGEAYGIVSGVMQINVQIPTGIRSGQPVSLLYSIGGNQSAGGVTVQMK